MHSSVLCNSVERGLSNPLCQTWLTSIITSELYTISPAACHCLSITWPDSCQIGEIRHCDGLAYSAETTF